MPVLSRAMPAVASAYGRTAECREAMKRTPPSPYQAESRTSKGARSVSRSSGDAFTSLRRPASPTICT